MQLPDPFENWYVKAIAFTLLAVIAGCLGHLMRTFEKEGETFSWLVVLVKTLSAGLTGFMMFLLCVAFNFSDIWTGIIVGVFGWLGADATIQVLKGFVYSMLKVDKEKPDDSTSDRDSK